MQQLADDLHAALLAASLDSQLLPLGNVERLVARVRLLLLPKLQVILIGNDGEDVFAGRAIREKILWPVRGEPFLQLLALLIVGLGGYERDLMRVERALDELAMHLLRSTPSLRASQSAVK